MTPGMVANSESSTGHTRALTIYEHPQAECSYFKESGEADRPALTVGHGVAGLFLSCQPGNKPSWISLLISFNFTKLTRFLCGYQRMFH